MEFHLHQPVASHCRKKGNKHDLTIEAVAVIWCILLIHVGGISPYIVLIQALYMVGTSNQLDPEIPIDVCPPQKKSKDLLDLLGMTDPFWGCLRATCSPGSACFQQVAWAPSYLRSRACWFQPSKNMSIWIIIPRLDRKKSYQIYSNIFIKICSTRRIRPVTVKLGFCTQMLLFQHAGHWMGSPQYVDIFGPSCTKKCVCLVIQKSCCLFHACFRYPLATG